MDEAHRYYAKAGTKAISELKPILGLELTATPKTIGAKPRQFKNIIYHYPLSHALADGFVKNPAVATRKDFDPTQFKERPKDLEIIKLEDGDAPRNFHHLVENKSRIRQMVFAGFTKCCYPYQKFDSAEGELRLAMVLEDDDDVLKWLKPAPGQFRIEYSRGRNYQPDFVVETKDRKFIIEPKRADQMGLEEVQEKAAAARQWVGFANEHVLSYGGKPWEYLLVPHDDIRLGATVNGLFVGRRES